MKIIRNKILQCLYKYSNNDESLITRLNALAEQYGSQTYPLIFHVLTHLDMSQEEAEIAWREICVHRANMSRILGHGVNLRTAICDYFCSIHRSLKNPKVVELHIFESTINSAKFDRLTGLYNRAYFDESIAREVARAKRYDTDLSILFLDLDNFKSVNDSHGHLAGDHVLKEISQAILEAIRSEDIASRYGGEEIVIILPETKKLTAMIFAERIRDLVERTHLHFQGRDISITISGGIASFPIDSTEPAELVKFADMALFKAKGAGKNCILPYSLNKRRYIRIDFSSKILVKEIRFDNQTEAITASAKNLSLTGILFASVTPYQIGTKIQIQIPFEDFDETVLVIGTVVRLEFFDPNQYHVGVSFLEVDSNSKNEISRYLLKKLGQKLTYPDEHR